MSEKSLSVEACMQNRELSWLKFNERVLQEANRSEMPLLERLKYISIFTSNLDEFFMVRVGALMEEDLLGEGYRDNKTGMTAREQCKKIFHAVTPLYTVREQAFTAVMERLVSHGVQLMRTQDVQAVDAKMLEEYFVYNVLPLLSPQIIDSRHPFPHIANKQLHVGVTLEKKRGLIFGLIAVPEQLERVVLLEGDGCRIVLLEDLIYHFADLAFDTYKIVDKNILAVTRSAEIDMEEDMLDVDIDYRQHMKKLLRKRQRLFPVRMEVVYPPRAEPLEFFCQKLQIDLSQVFCSKAPLDLSFCFSLDRLVGKQTAKRLLWPPHVPAETLVLEKKTNMLKKAAGKGMLFSYPFESIGPFLKLVRQAADDSAVLSIKITLYRIDSQSKLAESLVRAAENGKEVVVLLELRARFDESNNIEWAQRLEEAGCRIIYGLPGYKVHSKVCLITRKELGKIHHITQIGTGNYNAKTAKQYTDLSLITANQTIGRDAVNFFANLLIGNLEGSYQHLWVAPDSFKSNILRCIDQEREKAKNGAEGSIVIKCNSLTDKEIIEMLVAASGDGVHISLIIRGICCVIPHIPGLTENIRIISIVGRFLEHSRIFCFGTGSKQKIYISSADLMTRNTQRRVEIACPILDSHLRDRIDRMLQVMLADNMQAWEQYADGRYIRRQPSGTDQMINSQEFFVREAYAAVRSPDVENKREQKGAGISVYRRVLQFLQQLFRK